MFNNRMAAGRLRFLCIAVLLVMLLAACDPLGGTATPSATPGSQASTQSPAAGNTSSSSSYGSTSAATSNQPAGSAQTAQTNQSSGNLPEQSAIINAVNRNSAAVVTVVNRLSASAAGGFGAEALGTGMIVDKQGHIFTNEHVISGAAQGGLSVIFQDGGKADATLVGSDPVSDLAVLKINRNITSTVTLGNSDALQVGQFVIAIGSALGDFRNTVTVGVVSGVNRTLPGAVGSDIEPMIQTDAAINHGNSGGPLLDLNGNVVGMNTAVIRATNSGGSNGVNSATNVAEGLGFAIPINTVKTVTTQLISSGSVPRPFLGVSTRPVSPQLSSYYGLTDPNGNLLDSGELVVQVSPGSAAATAGLQPGDVIMAVNNTQIDANHPLANVLTNLKPGDTITLSIIRSGKSMSVKATLGTRPASTGP